MRHKAFALAAVAAIWLVHPVQAAAQQWPTKTVRILLPKLPTMSSIYPGFESYNWYAMFYPKGTPRAIVDKLNAEIHKALDTPDVKAFYPRQALEPVASSPEELGALLKREIDK
jgi:tripartite-type tricarboxylate transporter receptor subunit TctC